MKTQLLILACSSFILFGCNKNTASQQTKDTTETQAASETKTIDPDRQQLMDETTIASQAMQTVFNPDKLLLQSVQFRIDSNWYRWHPSERLVVPLALPRAEKDPAAAPGKDLLREQQLRLSSTLQRLKDDREAQRARGKALRESDPTRAVAPIYIGAGVQIDASSLSPNGRWLLLVLSEKDADTGRAGKMPKYVTESGYEEMEDVRTRVGRNWPVAQRMKLIDLSDGSQRELAYDSLPGIATDPMATMRAAQKLDALKGNRAAARWTAA